MKFLVITTLLVVLICFGANLFRAPEVEANEVNETSELLNTPITSIPTSLDQHIIYQIPDLRSTAGSAGKNIVFAEDGQNVAVIYSRFSGDPTNIMQVYAAYSTDRGNTWVQYGPLSTANSRRAYSAIDAEENWLQTGMVHFGWHQAAQISGSYVASPAFYAKEVMYPDGLITNAFRLPESEERDVWEPCIGVKDSFVIITAVNNGCFHSWFDVYIWRSTDYGETWDSGRVFLPGLIHYYGPHFRFGNNGYIFYLWMQQLVANPTLYWPYYCESFDNALTWTDPMQIVPLDTEATGWWYQYDCEVVRDTPIATVKMGMGTYDYGEIWALRPDSGVPGDWHFKKTVLIGDSIGGIVHLASFPNIAADDFGNIYIGYKSYFPIAGDTVPDVGLFVRPADRDTWIDWGRITFNGATIDENHLEFAHNAPIIANGDSVIIGMIYHNAENYPTTGNLYFDYYILPDLRTGINGSKKKSFENIEITASPNPFCNSVQFKIRNSKLVTRLLIYDVTGKLVRQLFGNSELIWNGEKNDGSKVNTGVYFYTVSAGNNYHQGKVILTR